MVPSPITSWQIEGQNVGQAMTDCLFLGSKITADCDCSHEIERHLAPWKERYGIKSRDITLPTKVRIDKAMVFTVVTQGCES